METVYIDPGQKFPRQPGTPRGPQNIFHSPENLPISGIFVVTESSIGTQVPVEEMVDGQHTETGSTKTRDSESKS